MCPAGASDRHSLRRLAQGEDDGGGDEADAADGEHAAQELGGVKHDEPARSASGSLVIPRRFSLGLRARWNA